MKLESRGPLFVRHRRIGLNGKRFDTFKFRTTDINGDGHVTQVGRVLRLLSYDELPLLINILKGDMSFIGRRPLREEDAAREVHAPCVPRTMLRSLGTWAIYDATKLAT